MLHNIMTLLNRQIGVMSGMLNALSCYEGGRAALADIPMWKLEENQNNRAF